ncbi:hypothetical protein ACJ41O_007541 [Fusarium nematophilum]
MQGAIYTLITVAAILIAARIYLRLKIQRQRLLVSDVLMILAWCSAFATASFDIVFSVYGLLKPEINVNLSNWEAPNVETVEYVLKIYLFGDIPFYMTFWLCKASLLATYLQVFPIFMVKRRIALWATITYAVGACLTTLGMQLFSCLPLERHWNVTKPLAECDPHWYARQFQIAWALHFFGSLVTFALPFSILYKLELKRKTKIAVYSVFLLGFVDISFTVTRFLNVQLDQTDGARSVTMVELWSALDAYMGLIVTCLPSLRPFLRYDFRASGKDAKDSRSDGSRRRAQNGFEETDDLTFTTTLGGLTTHASEHSGELERGERWNPENKSNRSDVELVDIDQRRQMGTV